MKTKLFYLFRGRYTEIQEFTFSQCVRLQRIWLPKTLQTIHVKAFMGCAILKEIEVPPTLRYIARKAFVPG